MVDQRGSQDPADRAVRILLVEDDDGIAGPLVAALDGSGYDAERVVTGAQALEAVRTGTDAVILDLGLPDADGLEVCRRIRDEHGADPPILVLTARTGETETVAALDAGADDYVTKPFRLAELQARIRALLRRTGPDGSPGDGALEAQDLVVDPAAHRATRAGGELDLTPTEFALLRVLVREAGTVVSRGELVAEVWDRDWVGSSRTVDMHISALRRKLGDDPDDPRYVTTVRGVGFRLEVDDTDHGAP